MIELNAAPADDFADLPEVFRPVAQAHGRALYEFVLNAQLAGEAAERLGKWAQATETKHATFMLSKAFNAVANAYAAKVGWTEAEMVACKAAIEVAFAAAGELVTTGPKLVLNS